MKKIKLFLLAFFVFGFLMVDMVKADTTDDKIIEIVGIRQGDELIKPDENGDFFITSYDELLYIEYIIHNIDNIIKDDKIYVVNGSSYGKYYGYEIKNNGHYSGYIHLEKNNEVKKFTLQLYECQDEDDCYSEDALADISFDIHFDFWNDIDDLKINIDTIMQGDKVLTPMKINEYQEYQLEINGVEDLKFKFKGSGFSENKDYIISFSDIKYILSGKELNTGAIVSISQNEIMKVTRNYQWSLSSALSIPIFGDEFIETNDGGGSFYLKIYKDESVKSFDTKLKYKNYKDTEIVLRSENKDSYSDRYSVNPTYHNDNNELLVFIKGKGYLNQDYDVVVSVTDNRANELYSKQITLNGHQINDGYEVLLDDFTMKFPDDLFKDDYYKVKTKIGNTTSNIDCFYGYNVSIISNLLYPNGQRALTDYNYGFTDYLRTYVYEAHNDLFKINEKMYMYYVGKNFENNVVYNYEFYLYDGVVSTLITKNKISGLRLNTGGLKLEINNQKSYSGIEYLLVIKKDEQIIQIDSSKLYFDKYPALANLELESRGKDIYLEVNNNRYIATKNAPLNVTFNGIGFENENTYELSLNVKNTEDYDDSDERYVYEYNFTGYELNNGLAKISFNSKDYYDDITVGFMVEESPSYYTFRVSYVDSKDLFNYVKKYIIDNTLDLIKNISDRTTTEEFQKNVEIVDNGNIKIYDETGKEEVSDYVGTGMIARINNEYDRSLLDMDVVVKGDVTGDGKITITDIIKVRRHLVNLNKLEGLYEMAGDTTDTGEISITDLIKMRHDLANISELE